jgi:phosphatidylethanolamine/phosphatidyl-N-methylethanolamine N-methyltransferase
MLSQLKDKVANRLESELRFFKGWLDQPRAVGTPFPTSSHTGRAMASVINLESGLPVLEIGPGTGVITREILKSGLEPAKLFAVECSPEFAASLQLCFPGVHVLTGSAFELDGALGEMKDTVFDCVISAIPLLNFDMADRLSYLEDMLDRVPVGRPVIQVTYGPKSPVPPGSGSFAVNRADFILRNVPPAHLWTYRRKPI